MKINKQRENTKKIQETKPHAISCFPAESFADRDHLRSDLGIISGLGIICGRGPFPALCSVQFELFVIGYL